MFGDRANSRIFQQLGPGSGRADSQKSRELSLLSRGTRTSVELVGGPLAEPIDVDGATIEACKHLASEGSDKIGPIFSGQLLTHLRSPHLLMEEMSGRFVVAS